jgi:hypothetical protein
MQVAVCPAGGPKGNYNTALLWYHFYLQASHQQVMVIRPAEGSAHAIELGACLSCRGVIWDRSKIDSAASFFAE